MRRPVLDRAEWRALARIAGGVGRLADLVGVSARTVRRWAQGDRPSRAARRLIVRVAGELGANVPRFGVMPGQFPLPLDGGACGEPEEPHGQGEEAPAGGGRNSIQEA